MGSWVGCVNEATLVEVLAAVAPFVSCPLISCRGVPTADSGDGLSLETNSHTEYGLCMAESGILLLYAGEV